MCDRLMLFDWFNEYESDGGPAAKAFGPKFDVFLYKACAISHWQTSARNQNCTLSCRRYSTEGLGGILFIFGTSLGAHLLLLHQMIATPILYDFYNYDNEEKEFTQLFIQFTQNMALFGALLFFIGMKNSISRRQLEKKVQKMKTV